MRRGGKRREGGEGKGEGIGGVKGEEGGIVCQSC